MIFSYAVTYGIGMYAGWEVSWWFLAVLAVCHEGIKQIIQKIKLKKSMQAMLCVFAAGAFFLSGYGRTYIREGIAYYGQWRLNGKMELLYGWILLYLLLAMGEWFYKKIRFRLKFKLPIAAALAAGLCWQGVEGKEWAILPIAAILYLLLASVTECYQYFGRNRKNVRSRDMFPFLAGVIILASVLPVKKEPISWEPVEKFFADIGKEVNQKLYFLAYGGASNDFSVRMTGVSETDGNFWGKLTNEGAREIMKVSFRAPYSSQNRYFVGNIKDIYENNQWSKITQDEESELNEYQWQTLERLYYLYRSGAIYQGENVFCRTNAYSIQYTNLKSKMIFYPAGCYKIENHNGEVSSDGRNVKFSKELEKDRGYYVNGLQMNLENPELLTYLREQAGNSPEIQPSREGTLFEQCVQALKLEEEEVRQITGEVWTDRLETRRKQIKKENTQLPKELPQRVKDLAEAITQGCENDYDRVNAITQWLKNSGTYSYTLEPEGLPEDADVVDYFLFETKEGYCTYFASAEAILCRCIGIPARYVEGVSVDYVNAEGSWYPINEEEAHAWTQVYLDGFGWIDVDATPGYDMGTANWEKAEMHKEVEQQQNQQQKLLDEAKEKEEQEIKKNKGKQAGRYAAVGAGGLAGAALIIFFITRVLAAYEYRKGSNRKKADLLMKKIMHCMKKSKRSREPEETLRMYAHRLAENGEAETAEVILWYETICYSRKEVSAEEIIWLKDTYAREKKRSRKEKNKKHLEKTG